MFTDASDVAVGAMLTQLDPLTRKLIPISLFSRVFSPQEAHYTTIKKELLSVIKGFKKWRCFLEGIDRPIFIFSDHKNLSSMKSLLTTSGRLARWQLYLSRFPYIIKFIDGHRNIIADCLSRPPDTHALKPLSQPVIPSSAMIFQITQTQRELLHRFHDHKLAGHSGVQNTRSNIRNAGVQWPGFVKDIQKYIATCLKCQKAKNSRQKPFGYLNPIPVPHKPMQSLSLDLVSRLHSQLPKAAILVVVDRFTKYCWYVSCPLSATSYDIISLLDQHIFA